MQSRRSTRSTAFHQSSSSSRPDAAGASLSRPRGYAEGEAGFAWLHFADLGRMVRRVSHGLCALKAELGLSDGALVASLSHDCVVRFFDATNACAVRALAAAADGSASDSSDDEQPRKKKKQSESFFDGLGS